MKKKSLHFACNLILLSFAFAQVDHFESVILEGDEWSYLIPSEQPDASWISPMFDDDGWAVGPSGFGYGDGDDNTEVASGTLSIYIRRSFSIVSMAEIESAFLDIDFDDGFVAYLNGVEIARSTVNGEPPVFNGGSSGLHEAALYSGNNPEQYEISLEPLREGDNLLAIEVHNESVTSSDLSLIPFFSVGVNTTERRYRLVPDWFNVFVPVTIDFESSNLPVVIIEIPNGQEIPSEPKIPGTMKIIWSEDGERNFLTDQDDTSKLNYDGNIEIEVRGSSSSILEKKQYSLTTYKDDGDKDNTKILGLPEENDWILSGLAFDPSLIRDYVSYTLSREIGQYASRGKYCELILNGDYRGLYLLQERLKVDKNRIDVRKMDVDDVMEPEITGGYVTKTDKIEGNEPEAAWSMPNYLGYESNFLHDHPKSDQITWEQHLYIRDLFFALAETAKQKNSSFENGYPSIIDLPSFIDFMLLNELSANVDGYEFSTFFHKDRNGKLRGGPVWDFNLTYGNDLTFWGLDRSFTDVWQFDNGDNHGPEFWKDLFDDPDFNCYLTKRWNELTTEGQPFHRGQIDNLIAETVLAIAEAVSRENSRWNTVGNHNENIDFMKTWLDDRVVWISEQLGETETCLNEEVPQLVISRINYHPQESEQDENDDQEFVEIRNVGLTNADLTGVYFGGTGFVYQFPAGTMMPSGTSIFLARDVDVFRAAYGFSAFDSFTRGLNNGGQTLTLLNGFGNEIDKVTFTDESPWPESADGGGDFLEIINDQLDNDDPSNWQTGRFEISILGMEIAPAVNIYPNPSPDNVTISAMNMIQKLTVLSLDGKRLFTREPNSLSTEISVSTLQRGTYIVEVLTSSKRYVRRLLVE